MTRTLRQRRTGYTLVEALVAMGSATFLLIGLATTLSIAATALDADLVDREQSVLGEARSMLHADLASARYFTERTSTAVTFAVPDRDGDGVDEVLRYSWSGTPGHPLNLSYNGGTPAPILGDVKNFGVNYTTETFAPSTLSAHVGYPHVYASQQSNTQNVQIATRFTVLDPVTVTSVAAYVGGHSGKDFRVAVYDDSGGEPGTLLTESVTLGTPSSVAWTTATITPQLLSPGEYWLAVAFEHNVQSYQYTSGGGEFRTKARDAVDEGFLSTWGTSDATDTRRVSIYAVHGTN